MKAKIHPTFYHEAQVTCVCGNKFSVGSTMETIQVDVCSNCHPYYTGQMKYLDAAGRVDKFKAIREGAVKKVLSKSARREEKKKKKLAKENEGPRSLAELRKKVK